MATSAARLESQISCLSPRSTPSQKRAANARITPFVRLGVCSASRLPSPVGVSSHIMSAGRGASMIGFGTSARSGFRGSNAAPMLLSPHSGSCYSSGMRTIALLIASNVFMTFAWYGHLKHHRNSPLLWVVLASWGIAFFEYCSQVPANRIGAARGWTTAQLKTTQEVVTLVVFALFSVLYMGESLRWNHAIGFVLIA